MRGACSVDETSISLSNTDFRVELDTGSSDLWVYPNATPVQLTNSTNLNATLTYAQGEMSGTILFATVEFGGYTIPSQGGFFPLQYILSFIDDIFLAFINATVAEGFDFVDEGISGILGMAFDDLRISVVNGLLEQSYGLDTPLAHTPILNIFNQNPSTPNFFDIRLDRIGDLDDTSTGTFLIGEHLPGFEQVSQQPQLPRVILSRWGVALDGMSVNGQAITLPPSVIPEMKSQGKLGVMLDSGYSYPPLPPVLVDAIYTQVPGALSIANLDPVQYILPCTAAINVSFTFGYVLRCMSVNNRTLNLSHQRC